MDETRTILRGQIYYINLNPGTQPIGSEMWPDRPAIIVSNDINNKYSNTVEVVYLTTKIKRKFSPTHVKVRPLGRPSLALCEQIHSVDKARLGDHIDTVSEKDMELIDGALLVSLGLTDSTAHAGNMFHKWELYINKYHLDIGMIVSRLAEQDAATKSNSKDLNEIERLQSQVNMLTAERDSYKKLLASSQKKLEITTEERDEYKHMYETATDTMLSN